jgi:hypothetical protein
MKKEKKVKKIILRKKNLKLVKNIYTYTALIITIFT